LVFDRLTTELRRLLDKISKTKTKTQDQQSPRTMSLITEVIESTKAIIQGMGVTLSYIPKRKQTVEYPDEANHRTAALPRSTLAACR
jgi:hypothetical protein